MAAALLAVLVLAKIVMLAGHEIPLSAWALLAFTWHDVAVAGVFGLLEWAFARRRPVVWTLYLVAAAYAAVNVPVARALSTPLTWPMLRAAGGPLADSIAHYATWTNAALIIGVIGAALTLPFAARHLGGSRLRAAYVVALLMIALGPVAAARVETRGLERNAWTALALTAFPFVQASHADADWRAPRSERTPVDDLTRLAGAARGWNVVVISLESTAAQYLGLYGASPDVMPNLSRLAASGIVFDQAYAVYPESVKGLFSILCSTYPAFDSVADTYADLPCDGMPAVFAQAGYRTALFHSGRFDYLGMQAVIRNRGFEHLEDAGDIGGNHESSFGVGEPATVDRMLSWIDSLGGDDRFFLTYMPIAGHHPYETPEPGPFDDTTEIGRYRNALHYGDAAIGEMMRRLEARGRDRRTLWVVYGDHGEAFNQHDGNYGHTFELYDENVRVPFVVASPGLFSKTTRVRRVVSLIDTAPTILTLAGLPVPTGYQGVSMLNSAPRAALFFTDYSLALVGIRDGRMKLIHDLRSGRSRLFDLAKDPHERADVSATHAADTAMYERRLRQWSAAQKYRVLKAGG